MGLPEPSGKSGVEPATIKYYLREGLLRPGHRVSATQAEYDESHLRRLRLVRALIQVGRPPVATGREASPTWRTSPRDGQSGWAPPSGAPARPGPRREEAPGVAAAEEAVERLLEHLGRADGAAGRLPVPQPSLAGLPGGHADPPRPPPLATSGTWPRRPG
ncbi:MerR family transcriptional regulator [Streptomyces sp. NPDC014685]|uniref:MerR family transcriptional regulator n=1 Tax=Streptomyces sp. NPDC014685 TaxID=3364881 RepID=UPI0036F9FED2